MKTLHIRCADLRGEIKFMVPAMCVYTLNRIFKNSIDIPVLGYLCKCHLNDFLGGGVFLCYTNMLLIFCKKKPSHSPKFVFAMSLLASLCWEYIAPLLLTYSVSDLYDVIAYVSGAFFYMIILNNYTKETRPCPRKIKKDHH